MTVVVEDVLRLICGHTPQSGRRYDEKLSFSDEWKYELGMHSAHYLVMCLRDLNGQVGSHIDRFNGVHGGHSVGQRNLEGRMLCLVKELCVK